MEAHELSVGNYVLGHLTKKWVEVDWLVIKHMQDGNCQGIYSPEIPVYEPIPITSDLLVNIGFKKMQPTQWLGNGGDYQPEGTGTIQMDYVFERDFIYRFEEWYYTCENGDVERQFSTGILNGTDWYPKISEGYIAGLSKEFLHKVQQIYFLVKNVQMPIKNIPQ